MEQEGVAQGPSTFVAVLNAYAGVGALNQVGVLCVYHFKYKIGCGL
jgi:hypothetical protein